MKKYTSKLAQILSLLIILFTPGIVFAQIQGAVRDTSNQPVPFANVLLLNQNDSTVATGLMATDEGTYSITTFKPGTYIIGVSMLGYKPSYSPPFVIKSANEHRHNEPIFVEADSHQLRICQ